MRVCVCVCVRVCACVCIFFGQFDSELKGINVNFNFRRRKSLNELHFITLNFRVSEVEPVNSRNVITSYHNIIG